MAARRTANARSSRGAARRPRASRSLAKLTRPRLAAPYLRERLFTTLDALRAHPVVWIAGPPGAGKTTLAATWLDARQAPGLWYQLDAGDGDPATFFYYLARACEEATASGRARLPLLTPDYRHDVVAFARRWFRELFSMLPRGAVLALDNYQEIGADSPLHRVLAAACDEIPEAAQLMVMSWAEPPAELSRALAQERLARVHPDALRLTPEEARGLAASKGELTSEQVDALHAASRGWAAGFTLLRERVRRTGVVNHVDEHADLQEVFEYFMEQVLRDVPAASRAVLLETALLPRFTEAMAVAQTGDEGAGELVRAFHRRHLFVDRRPGDEVTYEYHALFRAFLLDLLRRDRDATSIAEISARAAKVLEAAGWHEDALEALQRGGDQDGAARLLERLAPGLVAAGRGALLEQAFRRISPAIRDARPLLSYWMGATLAYRHQLEARAAYEHAHDLFLRQGDRAGQAMAATGVLYVLSIGWSNAMNELEVVQRWVATLERLLSDETVIASAEIAGRVYPPLFVVLLWHVPESPLLPICRERVEALLQGGSDDDEMKVMAATVLMEYYAIAGYVHEARRIESAAEPLLRSARVSPSMRALWWFHSHWAASEAGDLAAARARLANAVAIAAEERLRGSQAAAFTHFFASNSLAGVALDAGDLDAAEALVESLEGAGAVSAGPQVSAAMHWIRSRLAAVRGNLDEALRHAEQACSLSGAGLILFGSGLATNLASILIERGEVAPAREMLDRAGRMLRKDWGPLWALKIEVLEGLVGGAGDPAWRTRVTAAIRTVHDLGVEHPFARQPLLARQAAELLLSEGIAIPYVRGWLRHVQLTPSSLDVPNWPWPVRIRTLGQFRVDVDDVPLTFPRKAPRKPLQLLQALIAFGGEGISSEAVCEELWPDSEGDAAESALRVTLSRLRAVLKHDVILLKDGKLSLDRRSCWVDVRSLQDLSRRTDRRDPEMLAALLLDLYRGPFLTNEREETWMLAAREQLRRRFAAAVATVEHRLERDGRRAEARTLRRGAAERDAVALDATR